MDRRERLTGGCAGVVGLAGCIDLWTPEADEQVTQESAAVVSQHHLATEAGLDVLAEGERQPMLP